MTIPVSGERHGSWQWALQPDMYSIRMTYIGPSNQLHAAIAVQITDGVKASSHRTLLLCCRDHIGHCTEQICLASTWMEALHQMSSSRLTCWMMIWFGTMVHVLSMAVHGMRDYVEKQRMCGRVHYNEKTKPLRLISMPNERRQTPARPISVKR